MGHTNFQPFDLQLVYRIVTRQLGEVFGVSIGSSYSGCTCSIVQLSPGLPYSVSTTPEMLAAKAQPPPCGPSPAHYLHGI